MMSLSAISGLSQKSVGAMAILAACACVSIANIISKDLLVPASVLPMVFVQVMASVIVVGIAAVATGRVPPRRDVVKLALPGILQPGLTYVFAFVGLSLVPVSVAGLLYASETAIVAVFAWVLLRERLTQSTLLSLGLGGIGVACLTGAGTSEAAFSTLAVLLILAGISCAALDTIVARYLVRQSDPLTMTATSLPMAALVVALAMLVTGDQSWAFLNEPSTLAGLVISGLILHGLATILFNYALARLEANEAAALFPTISLMMALGGVGLLGERLSLVQIMGGAAILSSSVIALWRGRHE